MHTQGFGGVSNRRVTCCSTHKCCLPETQTQLSNLLSEFGACYVHKMKSQMTEKSLVGIFPGDLGKRCCYHLCCFRDHLHPLPQPVKTGVFIGLEGPKQGIKHLNSISYPSSQELSLKGVLVCFQGLLSCTGYFCVLSSNLLLLC